MSQSAGAHVLIVDDEALIRRSLEALLAQEGFTVSSASSGAEAWRRFHADPPDVVLLDLVLGDADGLDLLGKMKDAAPETKVVVISAHGSVESAVRAMKRGGYDFIKKPFELEEILATVRNAARTSVLEGRVAYLSRHGAPAAELIYNQERRSAAMRRVLAEVDVIARSPVNTVLVLGETGTGKQLIARRLHDHSTGHSTGHAAGRAGGPFVPLNCSAVPENLIESELFGHERGAFSGASERKLGLCEVADGGTLFLDEIGDLSPAAQAKLLTFLEERSFRRVGATALRRVDVRVVAATHRDLQKLVSEGRFRGDLWYRLSGIVVRLPPLRERREDIAPLAEHFLRQAATEYGRRWREISPEALAALEAYPWPGNVRELRAVLGRVALLQDGGVLLPEHLPAEVLPPLGGGAEADDAAEDADAPLPRSSASIPTLAEVEAAHIRRVLARCGGNRTLAAQHLGITRQTLARKVGGE